MEHSPLFNYAQKRLRRHRRSPLRVIKCKKIPSTSTTPTPVLPSKPVSLITKASMAEDAHFLSEKVYIVGGGPSLKHFDFTTLQNRCTITINKSIFHVPNPDYFISVDYTFLRKVRKHRFNFDVIAAKKFFVADFSHSFLKEIDGQIVDTRFNLRYNLQKYDRLIEAPKAAGIGYSFTDFRTGRNSGFCAFQLAVILGFKKIYLLGIDLDKQKDSHYHEGYGEKKVSFQTKLDLYFKYFEAGLEQLAHERPDIQVFSCSPTSRLNSIIEYIDIKKIVEEENEAYNHSDSNEKSL